MFRLNLYSSSVQKREIRVKCGVCMLLPTIFYKFASYKEAEFFTFHLPDTVRS